MASVYGKTYIKPHESFLNLEGLPTLLTGAPADDVTWRLPVEVSVQGLTVVVTTTIAASIAAPVLTLDWCNEDGTGRVEIAAVTIPDLTPAGTVIQRLLAAPVTVAYGKKLVVELQVAANDAGVAAGGALLMPLVRSTGAV